MRDANYMYERYEKAINEDLLFNGVITGQKTILIN